MQYAHMSIRLPCGGVNLYMACIWYNDHAQKMSLLSNTCLLALMLHRHLLQGHSTVCYS